MTVYEPFLVRTLRGLMDNQEQRLYSLEGTKVGVSAMRSAWAAERGLERWHVVTIYLLTGPCAEPKYTLIDALANAESDLDEEQLQEYLAATDRRVPELEEHPKPHWKQGGPAESVEG